MEKQRFRKGLLTLLVVFQMCSLQAQDQIDIGLDYLEKIRQAGKELLKKQGDSKYCGSYHFARTHERLMKITLAIDDDIGNRKNIKRLARFRKKLIPFVTKLEMETKGLQNELASSNESKKDIHNRLTRLMLYSDQLSDEITRKKLLSNDPQCQQVRERTRTISANIQKQFK